MKDYFKSEEQEVKKELDSTLFLRILIITLIISFFHMVSFGILKSHLGFYSLFLLALTFLSLKIFKNKIFVPYLLWAFAYFFHYSFISFKTGGLDSPLLPWLLFFPFYTALFKNYKYWVGTFLAVLILLIVFLVLKPKGILVYPSSSEGILGIINFLLIFFVPCLVGYFFTIEKAKKFSSLSKVLFSDPKVMTSFNASKMATLSEMAGGVSHEINNPLTIIVGQIYTLKKLVKKSELEEKVNTTVLDVADKIKDNSTRITKIIKELRNFAKDGSHDPFEEISLRVILSDAIDLYSEKLKNYNFEISIDCPSDIIIKVRKIEVIQAFANLVTNSFEYGKGEEKSWIKVKGSVADGKVTILFSDSGGGIDPQIKEKVFEPFFSTKLPHKTGLGLSIAQSIFESHNGFINLKDSEETCFEIILPTH